MPIARQERGNIHAIFIFPNDLARSVGKNGRHVVFRVTAARKHALAVGDGRGDALRRSAFDLPQRFSSERIEAGKQIAAAQEQLVAPFHI